MVIALVGQGNGVSGNSSQAEFHALMGASGCGKSTSLKKQLAAKKRPRTLIWSPKEEHDRYQQYYAGSRVLLSPSAVAEELQRAGRGDFHLVYVPSVCNSKKHRTEDFNLVCKMILSVGRCTMVVDELHTATTATHAVEGWTNLNLMGRASSIDVFGLSPRPASIDKDFLGNLSSLYVGRLSFHEDRQAMAHSLGVPVAMVASLFNYDHLRRDFITGDLTEYRTGQESRKGRKKA